MSEGNRDHRRAVFISGNKARVGETCGRGELQRREVYELRAQGLGRIYV